MILSPPETKTDLQLSKVIKHMNTFLPIKKIIFEKEIISPCKTGQNQNI